jgi:hypothetical protein
MMSVTLTTKIEIKKDEIWKVQICGDELQIVDNLGRQRHRSKGHVNTGVHFAMFLADKSNLDSHPNADEALVMAAKRFPEG